MCAIVDADTCALSVDSAILNEDAGTIANVTNIFQTAPFTNRAVSQMGSRIAIDPKDGNLFVAVGDRSTGDPLPLQAQQTDTYLGKVIHITPEGKPAPGNPALGLPEVWSMGHRTPQGLTFAPDGRLWEAEHGPRGGDELNLIEKGKNYGWPVIVHGINYPGTKIGEAIVEKPGLEQPRYYWDPIIAPSSLVFYQGNLFPQWKSSVLVGGLERAGDLPPGVGQGRQGRQRRAVADGSQRAHPRRARVSGWRGVCADRRRRRQAAEADAETVAFSESRADVASVQIPHAYSTCEETCRPPCDMKSVRHRQTA